MSLFDGLIKDVLPSLEKDAAGSLLKNLESVGEGIALHRVSAEVAHIVLKSIDGVVAAAVKTLSAEEATKIGDAYLAEIDTQVINLGEALAHYIPLQAEVEFAKRIHGNNSAEANAARAARQVGIDLIRKDIDQAFGELIGKHSSA